MIVDGFQRIHDYLRISLTDRCNLRCFYCMPEEEEVFAPSAHLMRAEEIRSLAEVFVKLGVKKIRLTGGEPLARRDAGEILLSLSGLPVQLTLTTNGTRLHHLLPVLQQSGVAGLNISLDTLQADKFQLITRRDLFSRVYDNILLAVGKSLHVKVNMVVMKGLNEGEILDFVKWTHHLPVHVRFIEFMPFEGNRWTGNKVFGWQEMLGVIGGQYDFYPLEGGKNDTARGYQVPGHAGTFSVISTMTAPFCATCNRIRLTADGKL